MIIWNEQPPDFVVQPFSRLFRTLPFSISTIVHLLSKEGSIVLLDSSVMTEVNSHLKEQNVELGGLLLGSVYRMEADGSFIVVVSDSVRSEQADSTGVSLRMSTEVWNQARKQSPLGISVVGWYHSHPNLGVFFSGTDRHTQRSFFNLSHCVGLVIDPIRKEQKIFIGGDSVEVSGSQIIEAPLNAKSPYDPYRNKTAEILLG